MPEKGVPKMSHQSILRYEEILPIIQAASLEGVRRVRITGGEPLVRKGIIGFVSQVSELPLIEDISLTTNGILLEEYCSKLKDAGLNRVNISLDSLNPDRYRTITRHGTLSSVLGGIDAAIISGIAPIKINVVLLPGKNDNEILDFFILAMSKPVQVRFIEYMPFGKEIDGSEFISQDQVLKLARSHYKVNPLPGSFGGGPANMYSLEGGLGLIGFISSRTNPFCRACTRLRLTAGGILYHCLDSPDGINVRGKSIDEVGDVIRELGKLKQSNNKQCPKFEMAHPLSLSDIGG